MGDGMMEMIIPPPGTKKVESFDDLKMIGIEVAMFQNEVGGYCVVMRNGKEIKGLLCVGKEQADKLYQTCIQKAVTRFICH